MATQQVITQFILDTSQYDAGIKEATGSMDQYAKEANDANKANATLGTSVGSAADKVKQLDAATKVTGKTLKDASKEALTTSQAFGAFKDELVNAVPALGRVGQATKALGTVFKTAFGPIAIIIGLVVGAIVALGKAFLSTERGADALQKVTSIVTTVLDRLLGIAQDVSIALVDAFSDPKQAVADLWEAIKTNIANRLTGIVDQFKALGEVIAGVFTLDLDQIEKGVTAFGESTVQVLTGVDDAVGKAKAAFAAFGAEIDAAAAAGKRLFDIDEGLEDLAIRRAKEEGRLNRTIAEQLAIARDVNGATEERKAAAEKAIAAQNQLAALALKENALLIERTKLENAQSDKAEEGQLKLAQLEGQREQIEADRLDAGRKARAIISGIDAENAAAAIERENKAKEKAAEVAAKKLEIEQQLNDNLDKLQQERELAWLSETDRAIAQARLEAQKEVEIAGAKYDELEALAAGNAEQILAIRAQEAESTALIQQGLVDQINTINATEKAKKDKEEADAIVKQEELDAARLEGLKSTSAQIGEVLAVQADGSIKSAEEVSKALLGIAFDAAENQATIAAFSAIAKEIGTKGLAGVAAGIAAGAIIKIAFSALRSQLAGSFYDGGIVGQDGGTRIHGGRDGYIANVHKGEHIMPTDMTNRYLPYLEMMREGSFDRWMQTMTQANGYSRPQSTGSGAFNDARLVGALGGVGSLNEQRKQTMLLSQVADGLNRGRNVRYTA